MRNKKPDLPDPTKVQWATHYLLIYYTQFLRDIFNEKRRLRAEARATAEREAAVSKIVAGIMKGAAEVRKRERDRGDKISSRTRSGKRDPKTRPIAEERIRQSRKKDGLYVHHRTINLPAIGLIMSLRTGNAWVRESIKEGIG